jgi:hypothetical protein
MGKLRRHRSVLSKRKSPLPGMLVFPVAIGVFSGRMTPLAVSQRSFQCKCLLPK